MTSAVATLLLYGESSDGHNKTNNNNINTKLMADNINYNKRTGRHSFVSVKKKAWHGLGTIVENTMTSEECIKIAGLDYNVIKAPNYADLDWGLVEEEKITALNKISDENLVSGERLKQRFKQNPKSFTTLRTDTREILGTVGADYVVVDNKEAFDFFDNIVGSKQAIYETAGALGKGEVIFITAKIPSLIKLGTATEEDNVERYIVLSNTHDGSRSLEAFITTIRVVCNNTLAAARQSATCKFRIRHTKNAKDRMAQSQNILGLENKIIEAFAFNAKSMTSIIVPEDVALNLICDVYFTKDEKAKRDYFVDNSKQFSLNNLVSTQKLNVISSVFDHYKVGPGSDLITAKDTVWGVYNAVSSYYQNGKNYKTLNDKMNSIVYGDAYNKVTKAYNVVSDYVNV